VAKPYLICISSKQAEGLTITIQISHLTLRLSPWYVAIWGFIVAAVRFFIVMVYNGLDSLTFPKGNDKLEQSF
jgi:hypothetical protein